MSVQKLTVFTSKQSRNEKMLTLDLDLGIFGKATSENVKAAGC
jgi:hypothetical protein